MNVVSVERLNHINKNEGECMGKMMEKNAICRYDSFCHEEVANEWGQIYCRALNEVIKKENLICQDCPLCGGFSINHLGEQIPECWYFDLDTGVTLSLPPQMVKERMDGLIAAGFMQEFPEYLIAGEQSDAFLVIERAIIFAASWHKGAIRKGSHLPYIIHPIETMMLVAKMTSDNDVIAAASLHDVIEDTACTVEELREEFGDRITELVLMESENKRQGESKASTWKVRKQENLNREMHAPIEAKLIMLADKVSNMRSTLNDYRISQDDIWKKFNMQDRKEQEWYYRSVAEVLKELADQPLYQEYLQILDEVFASK